jgi:cytochrome bd-type quinol oxidase subunit 2
MFFLFLLAIVMMAGVIYLAISRESSFKMRIAALGALALMIVTVIICFVLFFKARATPQQLILPDMLPSDMPPPPASNNNPATMIMFIIFLIALFIVIFFLSLREQKRTDNKEKPPGNDW